MITIIKYQANDGSEWGSKDHCIDRDRMIHAVDAAMSCLRDHPTECNWEGYVLHDAEALMKCKVMLFEIADTDGVLKWWLDGQRASHGKNESELVSCHASWFCRMLDGTHQPLASAYNRLQCIDDENREWNQPYFAGHGKGRGVMVEVNPI